MSVANASVEPAIRENLLEDVRGSVEFVSACPERARAMALCLAFVAVPDGNPGYIMGRDTARVDQTCDQGAE